MTTITDTRRDLDSLRSKHGARSAIGSRCSMLIEMPQNYQEATDPEHKACLAANMQKTTGELGRLLKGIALNAEER